MPTGLKTYKENKLPHLIPSSYIDLPLGRDTSQTHYITFTFIFTFTLEKCISWKEANQNLAWLVQTF